MSALFSIEQIKLAVLDVLSEKTYDADSFVMYFNGMKLLVGKLVTMAAEEEKKPPVKPVRKTAPPAPGTFTGYGSKLKKLAYEKLLEVRKSGMTINTIVEKSGGELTDTDVMAMIQGQKRPHEKWQKLAEILGVKEERNETS